MTISWRDSIVVDLITTLDLCPTASYNDLPVGIYSKPDVIALYHLQLTVRPTINLQFRLDLPSVEHQAKKYFIPPLLATLKSETRYLAEQSRWRHGKIRAPQRSNVSDLIMANVAFLNRLLLALKPHIVTIFSYLSLQVIYYG